MNDWRGSQASPPTGAAVGPTVAGVGRRLGAWLIDWVSFALIGAVFVLVGGVTGSLTENPEAARQLLADPAAQPTVPLLIVRLEGVVALAVAWVAAMVVYPAVFWRSFRCLPGQRIASLEVADAVTGANLSLARALLRSLALNGPPAAALAVMAVASADMLATLPASAYGGDSQELSRLVMASRWNGLFSLASLTFWVWLPALLISTAATFRRRGLHDRAGRSVVVRSARLPYPWPGIAWPVQPGTDWTPGPPPTTATGDLPDQMPPPTDGGGRPGWFPADEPDPAAGRIGGLLRAAPLGRRVTAYLVDGLLVYGIYQLAFALVADPAAGDATISEKDLMIVGLGAGAAQCAYFVASWWLARGSLGQRLVGLFVVGETGRRLGILDSLARWAVLQGPLALVIAMPMDSLPIDFLAPVVVTVWAAVLMSSVRADGQGRGYHDRIAGSRVILQG